MLFSSKSYPASSPAAAAEQGHPDANPDQLQACTASKISLGGGFRLPIAAEVSKIRLGGGFRLVEHTADAGTIRIGGGFRLPVDQY